MASDSESPSQMVEPNEGAIPEWQLQYSLEESMSMEDANYFSPDKPHGIVWVYFVSLYIFAK